MYVCMYVWRTPSPETYSNSIPADRIIELTSKPPDSTANQGYQHSRGGTTQPYKKYRTETPNYSHSNSARGDQNSRVDRVAEEDPWAAARDRVDLKPTSYSNWGGSSSSDRGYSSSGWHGTSSSSASHAPSHHSEDWQEWDDTDHYYSDKDSYGSGSNWGDRWDRERR